MIDADTDKRLAVHEAICAERYNSIANTLKDGDRRMTKIEYLLYAVIIAACDWTQIADSTADKTVWASYRTALRDLPSTITGDPRTFKDWPHDPNWVDRTI